MQDPTNYGKVPIIRSMVLQAEEESPHDNRDLLKLYDQLSSSSSSASEEEYKSDTSSNYDEPIALEEPNPVLRTDTGQGTVISTESQNSRSPDAHLVPLIISETRDNLVHNILSARLRKKNGLHPVGSVSGVKANTTKPLARSPTQRIQAPVIRSYKVLLQNQDDPDEDADSAYDDILQYYEDDDANVDAQAEVRLSNAHTDFLSSLEKEIRPLTPKRHSAQYFNIALQMICEDLSMEDLNNQHGTQVYDTLSISTVSRLSSKDSMNLDQNNLVFINREDIGCVTVSTELSSVGNLAETERERTNGNKGFFQRIMSTTTTNSVQSGETASSTKSNKSSFISKMLQLSKTLRSSKSSKDNLSVVPNLSQFQDLQHAVRTSCYSDDFKTLNSHRYSHLSITTHTPPPSLPAPTIKSYYDSRYSSAKEDTKLGRENSLTLHDELDECLVALANHVSDDKRYSHKDEKSRALFEVYSKDFNESSQYRYF
ncbi:hypothetical protein WICPIJ_002962 [Wickerhamomyces pijperi]|uniref:Uncharacterized protein n=1 Tax=Wickerhamomyces pijperi TaxID=599730 RepID=A0A9P8TNF0_WICPI|nr:hypothetical protein WICPIJ_002962 [Wickerhamomyces pijperi]